VADIVRHTLGYTHTYKEVLLYRCLYPQKEQAYFAMSQGSEKPHFFKKMGLLTNEHGYFLPIIVRTFPLIYINLPCAVKPNVALVKSITRGVYESLFYPPKGAQPCH
jgi:hypothetical protein